MSNVTRWVQRVEGVRTVETDLNSGQARVWFEPKRTPAPQALWQAVEDVGYEPTLIKTAKGEYKGPSS